MRKRRAPPGILIKGIHDDLNRSSMDSDLGSMRLVFEAAPIGIAISGPDFRFRLVNQRFADMLGYTREELLALTWQELTHPDDMAASAKLTEQLAGGERAPSVLEKRYVHKSGRPIWASLTARSITDSATGELLTLGLIQDVTERRRSNELNRSLSEQTSRLAAIIQKSPLAVILTNSDGEMTYLNSAALDLLGVSDAIGVLGHPLEHIDAGLEGSSGNLMRDLDPEGRWNGERYFRTLDDSEKIAVHVTAFRLDSPRSGVSSMAFVVTDIRQRKAVEAALRDREERLRSLNQQLFRAQEAERRRIARDLHDDVTQRLAMAAVEIGFLQTHRETDLDRLIEKLDVVRTQILEIADSVRNLSHQYHPSVLAHSNLDAALESLCAEFESLHGVSARLRNRADTSRVGRSTATAVYRIVQEGLQNVANHAGAQRVLLTLDCDDGGDELHVTLIDDGHGFSIGDGKLKRGLGLTSMQERAALIRGKIEIHSEPGEGTRLEITVPVADGWDEEED